MQYGKYDMRNKVTSNIPKTLANWVVEATPTPPGSESTLVDTLIIVDAKVNNDLDETLREIERLALNNNHKITINRYVKSSYRFFTIMVALFIIISISALMVFAYDRSEFNWYPFTRSVTYEPEETETTPTPTYNPAPTLDEEQLVEESSDVVKIGVHYVSIRDDITPRYGGRCDNKGFPVPAYVRWVGGDRNGERHVFFVERIDNIYFFGDYVYQIFIDQTQTVVRHQSGEEKPLSGLQSLIPYFYLEIVGTREESMD